MPYLTIPPIQIPKPLRAIMTVAFMLLSLPAGASVLGFVEYESTVGGNHDIAISPDGGFVYGMELESVGSYKINVYSRDPDSGALDLVESVDTLDGATTMSNLAGLAISPDGSQLYTVGMTGTPTEHAIIWFNRSSTTGRLTYGGRVVSGTDFTALTNPSGSMAISPDGLFLYMADIGGWGSIGIFQRAGNGVLNWVATVESDVNTDNLHNLNEVYVSPDGSSLYATSIGGYLYSFSRNTGSGGLTALQTLVDLSIDDVNGLPGLKNAEEPIVTADGRFLYLTGLIANDIISTADDQYNVVTFQRDTGDGTLTYLNNTTNTTQHSSSTDWDTLWWPTALALSPDNEQRFLYVGAYIADAINLFRRNDQTGALSWVGWEVDGQNGAELDGINKMALSPDGRHIYAGLENGQGVTVFDTRADLSLVKQDDMDPIAPSATLTYTLAVTNLGPADAQNLVITDNLPTGVGYVDSSVNTPGGSCSESGGTVTCTLASLAVSAEANATIEVTAPAGEGTITNTASVSTDQMDTVSANDNDTEDTVIGESTESSDDSDSSGGGGGTDPLSLLIIGTLLLLLRRRLYRKAKADSAVREVV
ncbi:MAG: beta-propeller fold lactonase family protein [Candidatus Thiodiazotropha sp.]